MLRSRFSPLILGAFSLIAARAPAQELDALVEEIRLQRDALRQGGFVELAELATEEALDALQTALRLVELPESRARVLRAAAEFRGSEVESEAIEWLYEHAVGKEQLAALAATESLGFFEGPGVERLQQVLKRGRSRQVRACAVGELLDHWRPEPDADRIELLVEQAQPPHSGSRSDLLRFLQRASDETVLEVYPDLLGRSRAPMENRALLLLDLAERPEKLAGPVLTRVLTEDGDAALQARALEVCLDRDLRPPLDWLRAQSRSAATEELQYLAALARHRQEQDSALWLEELRRYSLSSEPAEQCIAARLVDALPAAQQRAVLAELLKAGKPLATRAAAIEAVARLKDASSVDVLIEALDERDPSFFRRARRLLVDLTRRSDLQSARDWRVWWRENSKGFQALPPRQDWNDWRFQSTWSLMRDAPDGTFFGIEPQGEAIVFVIETSTWMQRILPVQADGESVRITALELVRRHFEAALEQLPDATRVALVVFDGEVQTWKSKLAPLNRRTRQALPAALEQALARRPGVLLYEALQTSFDYPDADTVIVLAAGKPERSAVLAPDLILADVRRWNRFRHLTFHSVALLRESALLEELARAHGGHTVLAQ
ncbi:MAG: hypothetical protein CMJ94_00540 [Planctomycetes bacterium]|nr:hypothetical protein [Planctomycetota bacterium]